jgi:hypothetical protein
MNSCVVVFIIESSFAVVFIRLNSAMDGDDEARGQPLDVPLPRRRESFVEVVDREDDLPPC